MVLIRFGVGQVWCALSMRSIHPAERGARRAAGLRLRRDRAVLRARARRHAPMTF